VNSGLDEPLVPQRKALALLAGAPDTLELLLRWCPEKEASRKLTECGSSIRLVVERLGTADRDHYLESARRIVASDKPDLPGLEPPAAGVADGAFADCELPELLTRFRHFRAQSVAFLESLPGEAWEREGVDPVLGTVTLGRVVSRWVHHDAAAIASLNALCSDLAKP
jgi:hypothetical protein